MIKVFTGPVKSGKTKQLIKEAIKQQSLGKTILFYNLGGRENLRL